MLGIMPTEVIENKYLNEILLFVSIKLNNWQQLKTKTSIALEKHIRTTKTLEQHNRLIEIKMI